MPKTLQRKLPPPVLALSIQDAARSAGISRDAVYRLVREGRLPIKKIGARSLILTSDLEAFLAQLPGRGGSRA